MGVAKFLRLQSSALFCSGSQPLLRNWRMVRNLPCDVLGSSCSNGYALVDFANLFAKGGEDCCSKKASGWFRNPCCEISSGSQPLLRNSFYACNQVIPLPSFATPVAKLRNVLANFIFGCKLMFMTPLKFPDPCALDWNSPSIEKSFLNTST